MKQKPPVVLVAASVLLGGANVHPARAERVTDPAVVNRYDTRFDLGIAAPSGLVGGTINVPWERFAVEGTVGWGLTGAQLSLMPKVILWRGGRNVFSLGAAVTGSLPTMPLSHLGERASWWQTGELGFQRTVFIDNVLYLGAGVTHGRLKPVSSEGSDRDVVWPEVRIGWGIRR